MCGALPDAATHRTPISTRRVRSRRRRGGADGASSSDVARSDVDVEREAEVGRADAVGEAVGADEGANLLGPNGFTNGVGPANLGMSFNIHV